MKERILEFLRSENKTSAQFAEEIGVQASGVSHILSGRNNPSLDFVLKMLEKYKFLSTEWLLFGRGSMYRDEGMRSLFSERFVDGELNFGAVQDSPVQKSQPGKVQPVPEDDRKSDIQHTSPDVRRIVWFYSDNSFREYFPAK